MSSARRIRVLILDDYPIYGRGLEECLGGEPDIARAGVVGAGFDALASIGRLSPDVLILDVFPPGTTMPALVRRVRDEFPAVSMLALGDLDMDLMALRLIRAGVDGFLLRDCDSSELSRAVHVLARGEAYFTPRIARALVQHFRLLSDAPRRGSSHDDGLTERELKVLELLSHGKSNREVAEILCLSERTVENHTRSLYGKLHVHDRTQAILIAQQKGYVRLAVWREGAPGNGASGQTIR